MNPRRSSAASISSCSTWTVASGKSSSPPAWSKSRWVSTKLAHVARREAEAADLVQGGVARLELNAVQVHEERAEPLVRGFDVAPAEAGIDHDEPAVALDEKAMTDEAGRRPAAEPVHEHAAERAHAAAIEVVDAHRRRSGRVVGRKDGPETKKFAAPFRPAPRRAPPLLATSASCPRS